MIFFSNNDVKKKALDQVIYHPKFVLNKNSNAMFQGIWGDNFRIIYHKFYFYKITEKVFIKNDFIDDVMIVELASNFQSMERIL